MSWITGVLIYFVVWWVVIFAVLPFGVEHHDEHDPLHAVGAPKDPKIKQKFIATTLISAVLWVLIYFAITNKVIDFHEAARAMAEQDGIQ